MLQFTVTTDNLDEAASLLQILAVMRQPLLPPEGDDLYLGEWGTFPIADQNGNLPQPEGAWSRLVDGRIMRYNLDGNWYGPE